MSVVDWWAAGIAAYIISLPFIAVGLGKWLKRIGERDTE